MKRILIVCLAAAALASLTILVGDWSGASAAAGANASSNGNETYDVNTLAGKVASVNGTAGLQIRLSAFIESEADTTFQEGNNSSPSTLIMPGTVLSSSLDGTSVLPPDVAASQDTAGAPQNETAIAVDPNNSQRIVAGLNDYVTATSTCTIGTSPCSAFGDGYSGTYFSNDGGATWCCASKPDGSNTGTLIPGVELLVGGPYHAGGDPSVAFDSHGHVFYAGLGFDRTMPDNTVAVNRGTYDASGRLSWGSPVFINQTTAPSTLNDKPWLTADAHAASPFRDNVYVTWTRFIFNPANGHFVQSPIAVAVSRDGGQTFSSPELIGGNVLYSQGSRPVVASDGTVYVFWDGATRLATLGNIWVVKSSDGGATWSAPALVLPSADASTRTAIGYPVTQRDDSTLNAPATPRRVDTLFPAVSVSANGRVYMSAYAADVVSPWQTCAKLGSPGLSGNNCTTLGPFINNARLDYVVTDLTTGVTDTGTTQPINTRYFFSGGFIGDYTDIAAGSDDRFHAFWTDTNDVQSIDWFVGFEWQAGTRVHNQDVVVLSNSF